MCDGEVVFPERGHGLCLQSSFNLEPKPYFCSILFVKYRELCNFAYISLHSDMFYYKGKEIRT